MEPKNKTLFKSLTVFDKLFEAIFSTRTTCNQTKELEHRILVLTVLFLS